MQVVIALPDIDDIDRLETPICGVSLLGRMVTTALRSGGSKLLFILQPSLPRDWAAARLLEQGIEATVEAVDIGRRFDPNRADDWAAVGPCLDDRFLWLPADYLAHSQPLADLLATAKRCPLVPVRFAGVAGAGPDRRIFDRPTVLLKSNLLREEQREFRVVSADGQPGICFSPDLHLKDVELRLVRRSGKATDGIYSRFNRMLCRPAVRWLSHTRITPNEVSFLGLAVAALAGLCFTRGVWLWDVAGALLFFVSGLFDEMDGMLARLKFQESPFGCWLETMADYSSYILIFAGMTVGGYRNGGSVFLATGLALIIGSLLSFAVISVQRRLAAPPDKPNEYARRYLAALDRDAGNPVSRVVRQLQFLTKKGVLVHYLLVFTVLSALPVVLFLAAFGANVAWMVTLYFNRRLFSPRRSHRGAIGAPSAMSAEVGK